jgi:hypothetical protein
LSSNKRLTWSCKDAKPRDWSQRVTVFMATSLVVLLK